MKSIVANASGGLVEARLRQRHRECFKTLHFQAILLSFVTGFIAENNTNAHEARLAIGQNNKKGKIINSWPITES